MRDDTDLQSGRRFVRWSSRFLLLVLVLGGCYWLGLFWYVPPLAQLASNHLSRVQGKAELLVAAGQLLELGQLSPDGRWIVMQPTSENGRTGTAFLWDLATGNRRQLEIRIAHMRWLNPDQFLAFGDLGGYYLFDAQSNTSILATAFELIKDKQSPNLEQVREAWRSAQQVYVIESFNMAGYTVVTLEQGRPTVYNNFGIPDKEVKTFIDQVPHIDVPYYARIPDPVVNIHNNRNLRYTAA